MADVKNIVEAAYRGSQTEVRPCDYNGDKPPKLTIRFPVPIKQTDRNKVEIDLLERGPDPFSVEFTRHVVELMGSMGGEAFLDEMAELIGMRLIIRNLR